MSSRAGQGRVPSSERHAPRLVLVIHRPDVDDPVETSQDELVVMIGDIGRIVAWLAHSSGRAPRPGRSPTGSSATTPRRPVASVSPRAQITQHLLEDAARFIEAALGEPAVEVDAQSLHRRLDARQTRFSRPMTLSSRWPLLRACCRNGRRVRRDLARQVHHVETLVVILAPGALRGRAPAGSGGTAFPQTCASACLRR
jgi:hypothetical protein